MKNSADSVAQSMAAALKSPEYRSLFKLASAEDEKEEHKHSDECDCDDVSMADGKEEDKEEEKKDEAKAEDSSGGASHKDPSELYGLSPATAFDVAIDSLITASAALDSVGMEKSSGLSLKLAALVVEAKKSGKSAKDKVSKEMSKQDKELNKTRKKEEKDGETKRTKDMEKEQKTSIQKGKDRAKHIAKKEVDKKNKAEKGAKVKTR